MNTTLDNILIYTLIFISFLSCYLSGKCQIKVMEVVLPTVQLHQYPQMSHARFSFHLGKLQMRKFIRVY